MDGFVERVLHTLEQVRDLFGLPTDVVNAATPDAAGSGLLASWSGASSEGHDAAAAGVESHHSGVGEADAALNDFSRALAQETADSRSRAEDLITSAQRAAASLSGQDGAVPAMAALVSTLTDHLAQAGQIVADQADRVPAHQQQLAAIVEQYAGLSGQPPASP